MWSISTPPVDPLLPHAPVGVSAEVGVIAVRRVGLPLAVYLVDWAQGDAPPPGGEEEGELSGGGRDPGPNCTRGACCATETGVGGETTLE